ncbi:MAG: exodeoxyribonuclease III [Alphaproteobacteria bacterium]|nr:exodeoxyribonuclease III [Alphaproteobacteria bacterium]
MPLTIAAWNVNSILARLPTALEVLKAIDADVVCLQELKCEDGRFPRLEIEDLGYGVETHGQKTYNGVAILSRYRIEEVARGVPGFEDVQSRYIEAVIAAPEGPVRVASLYAPNGNPVGTEKFTYKLAFMEALTAHAQARLALEEPFVIAGDYNVIPRDEDCHDPRVWMGDALYQPESRAAYRRLENLGFADAYMQADGRTHQYTFWDYQAGAWPKDHGIRIDHLLMSPQAADRLQGVEIFRKARGLEKPSDHVPIIGRFR